MGAAVLRSPVLGRATVRSQEARLAPDPLDSTSLSDFIDRWRSEVGGYRKLAEVVGLAHSTLNDVARSVGSLDGVQIAKLLVDTEGAPRFDADRQEYLLLLYQAHGLSGDALDELELRAAEYRLQVKQTRIESAGEAIDFLAHRDTLALCALCQLEGVMEERALASRVREGMLSDRWPESYRWLEAQGWLDRARRGEQVNFADGLPTVEVHRMALRRAELGLEHPSGRGRRYRTVAVPVSESAFDAVVEAYEEVWRRLRVAWESGADADKTRVLQINLQMVELTRPGEDG